MQAKSYKLKHSNVRAIQLTPKNVDAVADFCCGSIKGTCLPASEQVVDFWCCGMDHRIEQGDWVVEVAPRIFQLLNSNSFQSLYEEISKND